MDVAGRTPQRVDAQRRLDQRGRGLRRHLFANLKSVVMTARRCCSGKNNKTPNQQGSMRSLLKLWKPRLRLHPLPFGVDACETLQLGSAVRLRDAGHSSFFETALPIRTSRDFCRSAWRADSATISRKLMAARSSCSPAKRCWIEAANTTEAAARRDGSADSRSRPRRAAACAAGAISLRRRTRCFFGT